MPSRELTFLPPLVVVATAAAAWAGPPLFTEDPYTPGANAWEINLAWRSELRDRDWGFDLPLLDVNYGVTERIQLKYEIPFAVQDPDGEGVRGGLGNSIAGVKWQFLDAERRGFDAAIFPQFQFNTHERSVDRRLADDGWAVLLPFQVGRRFGPTLVYLEAGHVWQEHNPNEWFYGVAAEYSLSETVTLAGEVQGAAETDFADDQVTFNLGFKWRFSEHLSLLASAGRALREAADGGPDFQSYLGVQITF